jgi:pimeloyl-ACP methyl ester carboxylesterase
MKHALMIILMAALAGCATREAMNTANLDPGKLPSPNTTLKIPGLGPCTDNPDRSVSFDARQPINVLVHGCFSSAGQFRGLAQVLAFHGQQAACFTYDDRAKLTDSAALLRQAVKQLAEHSAVPLITIVGHSQGALVARKSLTDFSLTPLPEHPVNLRLVTISGPFAGIDAAQTCGRKWLYPLTLGLLPLSCYVFTGAKWADITESSEFIREPGALAPQVVNYLKIDTDERDTCRRTENGRCVEDDEVFSLAEQRNLAIETDPRINRLVINAGHVEIVGNKRDAPLKLIDILQKEGVIRPTAPEQLPAFSLLLSQIYKFLGSK